MDGTPNIAKIGTLLGDNTRAKIMTALMHGKALTATELANEAGVTPQTATTHLAKLDAGGLISLQKQGRHKYFALASDDVAALLETLMGLTAKADQLRTVTGPRNAAMKDARVCYNHLAGTKGIQLHDSLIKNRYLRISDGNYKITNKGRLFFSDLGIDIDKLHQSRSPLCRACLDWSERRSHLAGSLGRALITQFEHDKWIKRDSKSRVVTFTAKGKRGFDLKFS